MSDENTQGSGSGAGTGSGGGGGAGSGNSGGASGTGPSRVNRIALVLAAALWLLADCVWQAGPN
jgi:hypothetical protein